MMTFNKTIKSQVDPGHFHEGKQTGDMDDNETPDDADDSEDDNNDGDTLWVLVSNFQNSILNSGTIVGAM